MSQPASKRIALKNDTVAGAIQAIEDCYEQGWTDGLPVVPPTEERVQWMLQGTRRPPADLIGVIPPRMGRATVEAIATNAVMAGCRPEYLPVVITAIEAMLEESFNLNGVQATTHNSAPLVIVNGPIRREIGMNAGTNVFGHGNRANATIGRAVRLALINLGGGHPETGSKSTLGHPGRYTYCIAENEEESPWEPLHVEHCLKKEDSAVTVFACESPHHIGRGLPSIAAHMASPGGNPSPAGGTIGVVLSPVLAQETSQKGMSKRDVQVYLYEKARRPLSNWLLEKEERADQWWELWPKWMDKEHPDALIPTVQKPEDIMVLVAGGRSLGWAAVLPGWGFFGGNPITRKIER